MTVPTLLPGESARAPASLVYLFVFIAIVMTLRAAMGYSAVDEGIDDACVRGDDVRGVC